jgi:hypothetical protein
LLGSVNRSDEFQKEAAHDPYEESHHEAHHEAYYDADLGTDQGEVERNEGNVSFLSWHSVACLAIGQASRLHCILFEAETDVTLGYTDGPVSLLYFPLFNRDALCRL